MKENEKKMLPRLMTSQEHRSQMIFMKKIY